MASPWIKMRQELWTHPKFIALSNMLIYSDDHIGMLEYTCGDGLGLGVFPPSSKSVTSRALDCVTKRALRDVTMCALLRVWCAVNSHGKVHGMDAICSPMNTSDLDELAGFADFGEAMIAVGWARVDEDRDAVIFLNFLEHNELASEREAPQTNAERQKKFRERQKAKRGVTTVTKSNDREEKIREEYSSSYVPPESEAKSEDEEIQAKLIQVGITKPGVAALAIATAGVEATRSVLEWLESRKVLGCLPYASGVICNRLTQAGRASLPPDQGWNCEETAEYLKAVEKSKQAARKLRESVERIPIPELTARHGPWADGLDLSSERVKLERENQVWRMEPDSKVRVELMRRKEMEVRSAKAEAG